MSLHRDALTAVCTCYNSVELNIFLFYYAVVSKFQFIAQYSPSIIKKIYTQHIIADFETDHLRCKNLIQICPID